MTELEELTNILFDQFRQNEFNIITSSKEFSSLTKKVGIESLIKKRKKRKRGQIIEKGLSLKNKGNREDVLRRKGNFKPNEGNQAQQALPEHWSWTEWR